MIQGNLYVLLATKKTHILVGNFCLATVGQEKIEELVREFSIIVIEGSIPGPGSTDSESVETGLK